MKVHYNNALRPDLYSVPVCHPAGDGHATTTDISQVTCRNCLRRLGKGGRS